MSKKNVWIWRRSVGCTLASLGVAITGAAMTGCRTGIALRNQSPAASRPNVILITIDTLRADRLSCYGYKKPTTPFLDRIAAEGVLFSNAYSTSSWTAPSMASLFTALYPREHGVRHGVVEGLTVVRQEGLSRRWITSAEVMKAAGYTTFAILSNGHTSEQTGFSRGFDHFVSLWFKDSPEPNKVVERWLPLLRKSEPYFLWVHYFDPHAPYTLHSDWITKYAENLEECRKWSGIQMRDLRNQLGEIRSSAAARAALQDLYDGEIRFCDEYVRQLCEMLDAEQRAMVIVSADHGEAFLEHGMIGHGESLFEPVVKVPLIIRFPDRRFAGKTISVPVSNKDILPTIAEALQLESTSTLPGKSFYPLISGQSNEESHVFFELDRGFDWKGMRCDSWKFLVRGGGRKAYLFDLDSDPGESKPLQIERPEKAAELLTVLERWMDEHPVFHSEDLGPRLNERQREKLRSLGYAR